MPRDTHIPLFLWVATALLFHLIGGGGATRAADWIEEGIELRRFAEGVRSYVKSGPASVEVTLLEDKPTPEEPKAEEKDESDPTKKPKKDEDAPSDKLLPPEKEQKTLPEEKPPAPEPEKKKEEKKEEEKPELEKKDDVPRQELEVKKAIAVRQHVADEKQKENPDAKLLSEHNNHVTEETQARITSNDQDDPKPTPGSSASGVADQPGDSHETRIAHSEDRAGEEARAPSDEPAPMRPKVSDAMPNAGAVEAKAPTHTAPAREGAVSGTEKTPEHTVANQASPGSKGEAEQKEQLAAPELLAQKQGSDPAAKAQTAQAEQQGQRARKKRELPRQKIRGFEELLGLGASGTTTSGINLNLTPGLARSAIGSDQLSRERRADGARRRSQHLGSWKTAGIERWRSAIENYVPDVKPGNQTALNTARAPFAVYLAMIHNRLHPIFADWYLASLDSLPASNPLNNAELSTSLEIVLDQDEGRVLKLGVTKHSGVTAFDIAALDSVSRAAPFGPPPRDIVSPDGRVYFHWEFHRNPVVACTTYNARPYILKGQPKTAPPTPPTRPPTEISPDERQGTRTAPRIPVLASQ